MANTQLLRAISANDLATIRAMSVDLNEPLTLEGSYLFSAVRQKALEAVKVLVNQGADVNQVSPVGKKTALMCAIFHDVSTEFFKFILYKTEDVNQEDIFGLSALLYAIRANNKIFIGLLLKNGAKVNQIGRKKDTALIEAIKNKEPYIYCKILELSNHRTINHVDSRGRSAIVYLIDADCSLPGIRHMHESGARIRHVSPKGKNLLMYAARKNRVDLIQYFVQQGLCVEQLDHLKNSVLSHAIEKESKDVIAWCLKNNHCKDSYTRCFFQAITKGQVKTVMDLVKKGVSLNRPLFYGSPLPLSHAVDSSQPFIAAFLLQKGARFEKKRRISVEETPPKKQREGEGLLPPICPSRAHSR